MTEAVAPRRVLLKLSGEALMGAGGFGVDPAVLDSIAQEILAVRATGVDVAMVVGGGNFFRGVSASAKGMDRTTADHIGMLATIINCLALQDALEKNGIPTRVMSALQLDELCESYIRRRAVRHLEKGRVVVFAAGTGNPYFTTDTAAALRAMEIGADVIFKATKVDGVYDKDPMKHSDAIRFETLTYIDVIQKNLGVMDTTAISLCMDNQLPIVVFNQTVSGNITRALTGDKLGTRVCAPSA